MKPRKLITLICAQAIAISVGSVAFANSADAFGDVHETDYFYPAVEWGVENSITDGVDDTHFDPTGEVTRAQAVTFLWRMAGMPDTEAKETFSDVEAGSWYDTAVSWAVENEITDGTGDNLFSPELTCDRAMCLAMLYRMMGSPLDVAAAAEPVEYTEGISLEDTTMEELGIYMVQQMIELIRDPSVFPDVQEGAYYELPVVWGSMNGILTDDNTGTMEEGVLFRPADPCVRAEMISFLYRTKLMQDAANAPELYELGPITIAIPQEYSELVYRSINAVSDDEDGIMITVSELASREATESIGQDPDEYGAGELFSIGRVSKAELQDLLSGDMSGMEVFAKDENGKYYIYYHPTDVRYVRETNEQMAADQDQWTELNEWAWNSVRDDILKYSSGLTAFTISEGETLQSGDNASGEIRESADVTIDYGKSDLYTEEDMDNAIALIKDEFASWEGCELHSIVYAGDDCSSAENIKWMNELSDGKSYTKCIEFLSSFHSPQNGGGAWNPDEEYKDWQWWLARADDGAWELLTWGY